MKTRSSPPEKASGFAALTPAELGVLRLLSKGATNREIADALHIEETTVKKHVSNMLKKTGLRNRVALAVAAQPLGLAE